MNRPEKIAWFNLTVFAVSALVYIAVFLFLISHYPLVYSLKSALGAIGLCGIGGLGPTIFRKKQVDDVTDERDQLIQRRAWRHGYVANMFYFHHLLLGAWLWFKFLNPNRPLTGSTLITFNVNILTIVLIGGMLMSFFTYSVSIVLQYRNERLADNRYESGMRPYKASAWYVLSVFALLMIICIIMIAGTGWSSFYIVYLMLNFGVMYAVLHTGLNTEGVELSPGGLRILKITRRLTGLLFTGFYFASFGVIWMKYLDYGTFQSIAVLLFFLCFTTLIFLYTIVPNVKNHLRERRHEKT